MVDLQNIATGRGLSSVMGIMELETVPDEHLAGFADVQIINQTDGSYLLQVYQEFAPEGQMTAHRNSWEMIEARIPPVETRDSGTFRNSMGHQPTIRRLPLSIVICGTMVLFVSTLPVSSHATIEPSASPQNEQAAPLPPKPASPSTPASDAPHTPLGEAMALTRQGDCDAAIIKYEQVLQEKPESPDAYAGMTRCYLKKKDVTQAYDTVTKGLQVSDASVVRVALGEVYFRQGKIAEAEKEWGCYPLSFPR
jgi:tetratricopeptide (TPR) repeat protein